MNVSMIIFLWLQNVKLDPWLANGNPWYIVPAVIGLAVFIGLFYLLFNYIKAGKKETINNPHDLISQFRAMEEEGELTAEEFRNIKLMLAQKILGDKTEE